MIVEKALPKKERTEKVKKTPVRAVSKKKVGAGGRTKYTYPADKKGNGGVPSNSVGQEQVPEASTLPVSIDKLAARLGFHPDTIHKIAGSFHQGKAPGGKKGFVGFMGSHLKEFAKKHKIESGYWGRVFDASVGRK